MDVDVVRAFFLSLTAYYTIPHCAVVLHSLLMPPLHTIVCMAQIAFVTMTVVSYQHHITLHFIDVIMKRVTWS